MSLDKDFQTFFNTTEYGVAILNIENLQYRCHKMNDTLREYLQYSEEEINSINFKDLTHPEDFDKSKSYIYKLLSREIDEYSIVKRYIRKDKSILYANITTMLLSSKYVLLVVHDISKAGKFISDIKDKKEELSDEVIDNFCDNINGEAFYEIDKRRKYFRVKFFQPVCSKLKILTINDKAVDASAASICVKNIGLGGLKFSNHLDFPIDPAVTYSFNLTLLGHEFNLRGKIVRTIEEKNRPEYGVEFIMDETERTTLARILNNVTLLQRNHLSLYDCSFCKGCYSKTNKK
ncbi:PilZ domain-containing protein [Wukongibacter baidiensis]|uniref:PilZ domain-containing protein n=1 Tax=Wukongibacter baidiensis TaxID=1723361 RepID=UPI003D7F92F1